MGEEWTFEHTVECSVSKEFAWNFWTNVSNWTLDADIISVQLEGPFAVGVTGVTQTKSSGRIEWRVAELQPGRAVLEFPAPGAVARFVFTFEDVEGRTRIRQQVGLAGEEASAYVETVGRALQTGIPAGMRKLCKAMEAAARMPPD
jgi:hypothetical protein